MQTFIYTDASLTENDNGIGIEIREGEKSSFYRFTNLRFEEGCNNNNTYEYLGILLAIALGSQLGHKRIFIFCDNLSSIQKIQKIQETETLLFDNFINIQFGWIQNDMEEIKKVDYLSRNSFKTDITNNELFDIKDINYKEFKFNDKIIFKESDFINYLKYNCLIIKRLLGFKPNEIDVNTMVFDTLFEYTNIKERREEIENMNFEFSNKTTNKNNEMKIMKEKQNKYIESKKIEKMPIIENFTTEQKLNIENRISESKKTTGITKKTSGNKITINETTKELTFKLNRGKKIYTYEEILKDNIFIKLLNKSGTTAKDEKIIINIMTHSIKDKMAFNSFTKYIEKSKNKRTILLFIKIMDLERYSNLFKYSNILKKKDYRRSTTSIINIYNSKNTLY